MIHRKICTGLGEEALAIRAGAEFHLLFAGGVTEIGRRSADVVDISLEAGHLRDGLCFFDDGFMAARGHHATLQERDRAERAGAKAAARVRKGELNLFNRGHAAQFVIIRMPGPLEGQGIDAVKFLAGERHIRLSLDHVALAVLLADGLAAHRVLLVVLHKECLTIFFLAGDAFLGGRNLNAAAQRGGSSVADAAHLGAFPCGCAAAHPVRRDENGTLAHAEHQQVCAAVHKHAAANGIVPVIVVSKPAKGSFHAADGDRNIAECLTDQVAVYNQRAVGALGALAAWGVHVGRTALFRGGIVIDHAVNHAGGNEEAVIRPAKTLEVRGVLPVRLSENGYAVTGSLKRTGNDGRTKGGMIDICVADDIDKIRRVPAALGHVLCCCRRKKKAIRHKHAPK